MPSQIKPKVVIIGAGITGLTIAAQLQQAGVPFVILEKEDRVGGQIRTITKQGYTFETGPNTGVISSPEVAELFDYVQPLATLEVAQKAAAYRWIWKGENFYPLPSNPLGGLFTPLFDLKDKFGILLEPFRRPGTDPYESVGDLAERRLGRSFVDYAVDPFVGGIYAGDPYLLTAQFALPKLYRLEQDYGSFVRGAIQKARQPKSERDKRATKEVFSAQGGLESLVKALAHKVSLGGDIYTSVSQIRTTYRSPYEWEVVYSVEGQPERVLEVSHVVTTVRADILENILPSELSHLLFPISSLEYAPVTEITVGFDHLPSVSRKAFGGLVPSIERRQVLGILFPSSCFKGRTPYEDSALFTLFMEGLRNTKDLEGKTEDEILNIGLDELYYMMKIPKHVRPDLIHICRHPKAIPQYTKSSEQRWLRMKEIEGAYLGLYLGGGLSEGIGLAQRITQGFRIGRAISDVILSKTINTDQNDRQR